MAVSDHVREADQTRDFWTLLREVAEGRAPHAVLADFLEDRADPRAVIARNARPVEQQTDPDVRHAWQRDPYDAIDGGQALPEPESARAPAMHYRRGTVTLGQLLHPNARRARADIDANAESGPSRPLLIWRQGPLTVHAPVSPAELHEFIDRLPEGRLKSQWRTAAGLNGWFDERPKKLAREHTPVGQEIRRLHPLEWHPLGEHLEIHRFYPEKGGWRVSAFRPGRRNQNENWSWWTHHHVAEPVPGESRDEIALRFPEAERGFPAGDVIDPEAFKSLERMQDSVEQDAIPETYHMARMRAAPGGTIVNNTYQDGGQFLAKPLQKIRGVVARWRQKQKPTKLARYATVLDTRPFHHEFDNPENRMADYGTRHEQHAAQVLADAMDDVSDPRADIIRGNYPGTDSFEEAERRSHFYRATTNKPNSRVYFEHNLPDGSWLSFTGLKGQGAKHVRHWVVLWKAENDPSKPGTQLPIRFRAIMSHPEFRAWLRKWPTAELKRIFSSMKRYNGRGEIGPMSRLSRPKPVLPGHLQPLIPAGQVEPLAPHQIAQIADAHGLPTPDLSKRENIEKFFDDLVTARHSEATLKKRLLDNNPKGEDHLVLSYMIPHLIADSNVHPTAGLTWYNGDVGKLEKGAYALLAHPHDRLLWRHGGPYQTLFKALIAATSAGQDPSSNVQNAVRILEAGYRNDPRHPFESLPAGQDDRLEAWLAQQHPMARHAGTTPQERHEWWLAHSRADKESAEYRSKPAYVTKKGEQLIAYEAPLSQELRPGETRTGKLVVLPGMGKYLRPDAKALRKPAALPATDEHGDIQPKAWTARDSDVLAARFDDFRHIMRHFDGDATKVQHWLLTEHPREEFETVVGRPYEDKDEVIPKGQPVPGMFFLGPKFGAFALNMHQPTHPEHARYLTADVWWTRTWNRFMGTLRNAATGKPQETPRSPEERRRMWTAAKYAAKLAGFKSVADLQANLWIYEQRLGQMFGGTKPSPSLVDGIKEALKKRDVRMKLSRFNSLVDTRPFFRDRLPPKGVSEMHAFDAAGVLADKLDDAGDPRADLIRENHQGNLYPDLDAVIGSDKWRNGEWRSFEHKLPDQTRLMFTRGRSDDRGQHWGVLWHNPSNPNIYFRKLFTHPDLVAWLKRWPIDELKKILKTMRRANPGSKLKLARGRTRSFWVSPQGEMHEVGDYGHQQFAQQQGEAGVPELQAKGWARVVGSSDLLMTDTPNPRQMRALRDHAIENGYSHVWNTTTDRPLWSRPQDEEPHRLSRPGEPDPYEQHRVWTPTEHHAPGMKNQLFQRVSTALLSASAKSPALQAALDAAKARGENEVTVTPEMVAASAKFLGRKPDTSIHGVRLRFNVGPQAVPDRVGRTGQITHVIPPYEEVGPARLSRPVSRNVIQSYPARAARLQQQGKLLPLPRLLKIMLTAADRVWNPHGIGKTKLARIDPKVVKDFSAGHVESIKNHVNSGGTIRDAFCDPQVHQVFADALEDADDPRHEIVRRAFSEHGYGLKPWSEGRARAIDIADGAPTGTTPDYTIRNPSRYAQLKRPDGEEMIISGIPGKAGMGWHVHWGPPNAGLMGRYNAAFTGPELAALLGRLEPEDRAALVKDLKRKQGPMRLARLADVRPFAAAHDVSALSAPFQQDETYNSALTDYLEERDDPRAAIVRPRRSWHEAQTAAINATSGAYNRKSQVKIHTLSDGSELWMEPFGSGPDKRHWAVGWTGAPGGVYQTLHGTTMTHRDFVKWLNTFDGNERKSILKTLAARKAHPYRAVGAHPRANKLSRVRELIEKYRGNPDQLRQVAGGKVGPVAGLLHHIANRLNLGHSAEEIEKGIDTWRTRRGYGPDVKLNRENGKPRGYWQDPKGNIYPLPPGGTHDAWAQKHEGQDTDDLLGRGWNRLVNDGRTTLYVERSKNHGPLTARQHAALVDHAIENGFNAVMHDWPQNGVRTIWERERDEPQRLARSKRFAHWMDPAGELHPLDAYQTHQEWADQKGESEESLKAKGWSRIVPEGDTLYVDRDLQRAGSLGYRESRSIVDHAIGHGYKRVVLDGLRPRVIWEDEYPESTG